MATALPSTCYILYERNMAETLATLQVWLHASDDEGGSITRQPSGAGVSARPPAGRPARYFPHRHTDRSLHPRDAMDAPCDAGNSTHSRPLWLSVVQGCTNLCAVTRWRVQMVLWDELPCSLVMARLINLSNQPPTAILETERYAAGCLHRSTNPHGVTSLNNVILTNLSQ
jgi:hypothetical protein